MPKKPTSNEKYYFIKYEHFLCSKTDFASFQIWLSWRRQTPILGTLNIESAFTGNEIKTVNGKYTDCISKKKWQMKIILFKAEIYGTKSEETDDIQLNWQKLAENVMKRPGKALPIGSKTVVQLYLEIF